MVVIAIWLIFDISGQNPKYKWYRKDVFETSQNLNFYGGRTPQKIFFVICQTRPKNSKNSFCQWGVGARPPQEDSFFIFMPNQTK